MRIPNEELNKMWDEAVELEKDACAPVEYRIETREDGEQCIHIKNVTYARPNEKAPWRLFYVEQSEIVKLMSDITDPE